MSSSGDFGNPLRKFKLVFLGEQSGECPNSSVLTVCVRVAVFLEYGSISLKWDALDARPGSLGQQVPNRGDYPSSGTLLGYRSIFSIAADYTATRRCVLNSRSFRSRVQRLNTMIEYMYVGSYLDRRV